MPAFKKKERSELEDDFELKLLEIKIERSRIKRERAILVFNQSLFIYFSFLFIAVFGFVNHYLNAYMLNVLVIAGLLALFIGALPNAILMYKEDKKFDDLYKEYKKRIGEEG